MLKIISPKEDKIVLEALSPEKNIDIIKNHIKFSKCNNMTVDISSMNIIDACTVSTICSAHHYIKYPDGKIKWIVNSKKIEEYTSKSSLGNNEFVLS